MLYGSMIKEMDDVVNYMTMHPMSTMLTEETLAISANVNIGKQKAVNITDWLTERPPEEQVA